MGLFNNKENAAKPVKTPETVFHSARSNLLLVVGFTAINVILQLISSDMYFLFSATTPMAFLDIVKSAEVSALLPVAAVLAFIIIGVYLLCWFMSKKQSAWLIVAAVLFGLDTLVLLGLYDLGAMIIDLLMHAWVLYYLITGSVAAIKMKKQPPVAEISAEAVPVSPEFPVQPAETPVTPAVETAPVAESAQVLVNGEPIQGE